MASISTTSNRDLMAQARDVLRGNWLKPVLLSLVYILVAAATGNSNALNLIFSLGLGGAISLGFVAFYLAIVRERRFDPAYFAQGFQQFVPAFITYWLLVIFIVLWSLLLLIPGILAGLSYAMSFYVLHDQQEKDALAAIKRSKELMYGNRWKLVCLGFRFVGWFMLGILTLGIGLFWVLPYMQTSTALFYEDLLRNEQVAIEP